MENIEDTYQDTTPEGIQYTVVDGHLTRLKLSGSDTQKSWSDGSERLGKKTERGLKKIFEKYRVDSETEVDFGEYTQQQFDNSLKRAGTVYAARTVAGAASILVGGLALMGACEHSYQQFPVSFASFTLSALYGARRNPYAKETPKTDTDSSSAGAMARTSLALSQVNLYRNRFR